MYFYLVGKIESGLPSISLPPFSVQVGNQTYTFVNMLTHYGSGIVMLPLISVLANVAIAKAFGIDCLSLSNQAADGWCHRSQFLSYRVSNFVIRCNKMIFLQQPTPLLMQRRRCWHSVSAIYSAASYHRCQLPVRLRGAQSAVPAAYKHLWPVYIPVKYNLKITKKIVNYS